MVSWELALRADGYADNTVKAYQKAVQSLADWLAERHPEVGPIKLDRQHIRAGAAPATGLAAMAALAGRRWPPVRTGLTFGAASGNPAPGRGPAGCLPVGLSPGRRPRQGRYAPLRDGLRPLLTRPSFSRPGDTGPGSVTLLNVSELQQT
jgi:hypothetical protein